MNELKQIQIAYLCVLRDHQHGVLTTQKAKQIIKRLVTRLKAIPSGSIG